MQNSNRRWTVTIVAALVAGATLANVNRAEAQIGDLIREAGIGLTVGFVEPLDDDVDGGPSWGVLFGLSPREGFGLAVGFGWFSAGLDDGLGNNSVRVARVNIRPFMAGIAYTWLHDKLALSPSITAGYSFNSGSLDDDYLAAIGASGVDLEVGNSFALRPSFEVSYFVAPKFSINGLVGYLFTEPEITLTRRSETISNRWDASSFTISAGFIFYPFRR